MPVEKQNDFIYRIYSPAYDNTRKLVRRAYRGKGELVYSLYDVNYHLWEEDNSLKPKMDVWGNSSELPSVEYENDIDNTTTEYTRWNKEISKSDSDIYDEGFVIYEDDYIEQTEKENYKDYDIYINCVRTCISNITNTGNLEIASSTCTSADEALTQSEELATLEILDNESELKNDILSWSTGGVITSSRQSRILNAFNE